MKICVICFGFRNENLRKQPWRYVNELITDPDGQITPRVSTDRSSYKIDEVRVRSVDELHSKTGYRTRCSIQPGGNSLTRS